MSLRPFLSRAISSFLNSQILSLTLLQFYLLSQALGDPEFIPVDNEFLSVLGRDVSLPNEFKENYEHWLEREVFGSAIDWDCLLLPVKY